MRIWPHFKRPHLALVQALWWMLGWVLTCSDLWMCLKVCLAIGVLMNYDSSNRWMHNFDMRLLEHKQLESLPWMFNIISMFYIFCQFRVGHMPFTIYTCCFCRDGFDGQIKVLYRVVCNQSIQYPPCTQVFWVLAYTFSSTFPHQTILSWNMLDSYP